MLSMNYLSPEKSIIREIGRVNEIGREKKREIERGKDRERERWIERERESIAK